MPKQRKAPEALTAKYQQWIRKARTRGMNAVAYYSCPACAKVIGTLAAPFGEVWDSLSVCPFCGDLHFKVVDGDTVSATSISPEDE